jgi:hypothetical protein
MSVIKINTLSSGCGHDVPLTQCISTEFPLYDHFPYHEQKRETTSTRPCHAPPLTTSPQNETCGVKNILNYDSACAESAVYIGNDPRLVSAGHSGQRLILDKPPGPGYTEENAIENDKGYQVGYKKSYKTTSDGSIQYYYSEDLASPFIPQLFGNIVAASRPAQAVGTCAVLPSKGVTPYKTLYEPFTDPMGICKPHYFLQVDCKKMTGPAWLRDSEFQRVDLLSRQLWNRNQTSFEVNNSS